MICFEVTENSFKEVKDIGEYLKLGENKVLSIVGAGGKTSILYYIANREGAKGKKVVAMTSTQMYKPDECFAPESGFYGEPEVDTAGIDLDNFLNMTDMLKMAAGWNYYITGKINSETGKLHAPSGALYTKLIERNDVVVIEADGSKRKPVKFPREGEPVIYPETNVCLVVMGLTGLGQPIGLTCARAELACKVLGKNKEDKLTEEDIAKLIKTGYLNPLGAVYPDMKLIPIINQIDDSDMVPSVKKIAGYLNMPILGSVMEPEERKDPL